MRSLVLFATKPKPAGEAISHTVSVAPSIPVLNVPGDESATKRLRSNLCALAIMAKAPWPGTVKTRLCPSLSPQLATGLSICFLRDTAEHVAALAASGGAAGLVAYTPVGDESLFEGLLPETFSLVPQRGGDFGERLFAVAEDILGSGFGSVCLIDADSPTVPTAAYEQAIAELARPGDRIVLGPSADGGYYLIGMKHAHREMFQRISWSTETVYAETRDRAVETGLELVELPLWYDVDDGATLDILKAELLAGIAPGFATLAGYTAPHTRNFLLTLDSPRGSVPQNRAD
jgi:uncharacterized protein